MYGLYINNNQLSGSIPAALGNTRFLKSLNLSNNQLSDTIPKELGNINSLISLDLSYNQLSGNIPKQICTKRMLTDLRLNNNRLSGSIPNVFDTLGSLANIYLSQNNLTGTIPVSTGNLKNLKVLSLAHNDLSGIIPDTLRSCTGLVKLQFAYNTFRGVLPTFLTALPVLDTVNIEHDNFTFDGMELLVQHNFNVFVYDDQRKIAVHQNGNVLSVHAGGTFSNNTYKWFKGSTLVATKQGDSTYTPAGSGTYHVQITNSICTELVLESSNYTFSALLPQQQNIAALQTNNRNGFSIYPNPAHDFVNIYCSNTNNAVINMYDVNGKLCLPKK